MGVRFFYNTRDIETPLPDIFKKITITEKVRQELRKEMRDWFEAEADSNQELNKAETRLTKLERMGKNLQRLVIEEEISFDDFKEHRSQIEAERARLTTTVDAIRQRQHLVEADFEIALQLATELDFLFDRGNFDEKCLLCETVFKRLYVENSIITGTELNAPFSMIATRATGSESVPSGGEGGTRTPTGCPT